MNRKLFNSQTAIRELRLGREKRAHHLFRLSARKYPSDTTIGNLGVYYYQYGMMLGNGVLREAKKIGLKYLLMAAENSNNWQINVNAATALAECGEYIPALDLYRRACNLSPNELVFYNMGVCLYRLGRYNEAKDVFGQLQSPQLIDQIVSNGGQNPLVALCYCSKMMNNESMLVEEIGRIPECYYADDMLDIFYLKYCAQMYESAVADIPRLLELWYPSTFLLAVIADCISFVPGLARHVNIPEEKTVQWRMCCMDACLRKNIVAKYHYVPPFICLIQFFEDLGTEGRFCCPPLENPSDSHPTNHE